MRRSGRIPSCSQIMRHLAGRGKEKPFAAPCRRGGRKNLLEKVLSFPPCTPAILFQNFLCSLFALELRSKAKSGTSVLKMNRCKMEIQGTVCISGDELAVCTVTLVVFMHMVCQRFEGSRAKRHPTVTGADVRPQRHVCRKRFFPFPLRQ